MTKRTNPKSSNCHAEITFVLDDLTLTLYLNKFIDQYQIQEIDTFLKRENPSSENLKTAITSPLKKYNKGEENFYKLLDLILQSGVWAYIPMSTNRQENPIIPDISQKENKFVNVRDNAWLYWFN